MKDRRAERLDVGRHSPPRHQLIEYVGAAIDLRYSYPGRALGRHTALHDLMQAAEHDIGQHMSDRVPGCDGARPLGIQQTAFRGAYRDRGERSRHCWHPRGRLSTMPKAV